MSTEATIRDVARYANVSIATVSRVLNDSPAVRANTRERVMDAIEALNYSPNPIARKLSRGTTHTIAVVLPLFTLPSFVERLRGVHEELAKNHYDLVLYNIETARQRDEYINRLAARSRTDGILLISLPPTDEQAEQLMRANVPTVLIDADHPAFPHIIVDDNEGGFLATRHLVELGHRRIAFLSDFLDTPFQKSMKHRYDGYRRAIAEAGIPFRADYHVMASHGRHEARRLAHGLMRMEDPPTAIFAASDTQAIGVMDAAQDLSLQVPSDVSVIGFDGIRDARYLNLTTIEQPLHESGTTGAAVLLDLLRGEPQDADNEIVLPLTLVTGGTTAAPAGAARLTN